jgi:hypothetical protein
VWLEAKKLIRAKTFSSKPQNAPIAVDANTKKIIPPPWTGGPKGPKGVRGWVKLHLAEIMATFPPP